MGIAWVDDGSADEADTELRHGGRPLLMASTPWPTCPIHGTPMLFRAQIPLALTALTAFDDRRILSVFECHHPDASKGNPCKEGVVLVQEDTDLLLREPPSTVSFDVLLTELGPSPDEVQQTLHALDIEIAGSLPSVVLEAVPPSIAEATVSTLRERGATVRSESSPPTILPTAQRGNLVPFDDAMVGMARTTLPPLEQLMTQSAEGMLRGMLGGPKRSYRDHAYRCPCGEPTRTAAHLLRTAAEDPRVELGPTHVQFCTRCGRASVHRGALAADHASVRDGA